MPRIFILLMLVSVPAETLSTKTTSDVSFRDHDTPEATAAAKEVSHDGKQRRAL